VTADQVLEAARRRGDVLVLGDWTALAALLHARFCYTNSAGERYDRDGYLMFVSRGPLRWIGQRLTDPRVTMAGEVAVLTAIVHDNVVVGDEEHSWTFSTTQTYVRERRNWLYLAGHTGPALRG
jgi:hypothetical protein